MNKLQLRKHGAPQTVLSNRIWTQEHTCCMILATYGPRWARFRSGGVGSPDGAHLEEAGAQDVGNVLFVIWGHLWPWDRLRRCVSFRRVLHMVCLQSATFLCAGCTWQRYTYKVTYLFTSEDFWKNGIYCLFSHASCFYFHLILVISYSHVMQYVSLKEF